MTFLLVTCMLFVSLYTTCTYVVKASSDDGQECAVNAEAEVSYSQCCYALNDVLQIERRTKDCLKEENADLKRRLNNLLVDTCTDYVISTLLNGNATLYSASSVFGEWWAANRAALKTEESESGWAGAWGSKALDINQYLQIDMVTPKKVIGVATQGRHKWVPHQWVTKYRVLYSIDCVTWRYIGGRFGTVFHGNDDTDTIVENMFENAVVARCVRINPTEWHNHISMRADVIGCPLHSPV